METAKGVLIFVGVIIVTAAIAVGSWQLGWLVKEKDTDRQVQIDNRNLGTQTAWHDEAIKTISDYELVDPSNTAARGALRTKACNLIPRLRPDYLTVELEDFELENC